MAIWKAVFRFVGQYRSLIEHDSIAELSTLIVYPLKRQNPLPDISSPQEFISYYPVLIDSVFKKSLAQYDLSDIRENNLHYGFGGKGSNDDDIWLDYDGNLTAINYGVPHC